MEPQEKFPAELITFLRAANKVAVLTGAGISAESGVPTFREALTGLWAQFNPQELATPEAFHRDPRLVWEWYAWRRELVSQVKPNPAHFALVEMEKYIPEFHLVTQNIDGLHHLAGSRSIIELHGNLMRTKCFKEEHPVESWPETEAVPPHCPTCGSLLRPDVVWFGESLPAEALHTAMEAARSCDVFFSIGTSGVVQPAASLPLIALEQGAVLVEINPEETALTRWASYSIPGLAGVILPALVQAVWNIETPL